MGQKKKELLTVQKLAQDLATFAIDRTDTKELIAAIAENSNVNLTTIEYELQILKILSVGWAISFFMPVTNKNKAALTQTFWELIRELSKNISTLTQSTTGQNIDYFKILKERLDIYLAIMQQNSDETENPAAVIGPAFAKACNCEDEAIAILTGTKMFSITIGSIKEYLNSVKIDDIKFN